MTTRIAPSRIVFWATLIVAVTLLYCALYEAGFIPFADREV